MLLEKDGVDLNSEDNQDQTALPRAAENSHGEVVQMLLEKDGVNLCLMTLLVYPFPGC